MTFANRTLVTQVQPIAGAGGGVACITFDPTELCDHLTRCPADVISAADLGISEQGIFTDTCRTRLVSL